MVELEEVLERICIALLTLEFLDELELTVQKVLVTSTETHEGARHVLTTKLSLARSEVYRCVLHGVQRGGENR